MTASGNIHRQQHLLQLGSFVRGLRSALLNSASAGVPAEQVLQSGLAGECVQCGIRLSGAELLEAFSDDSAAGAKLVRLRGGYCARNKCDSYYYNLEMAEMPGIDWANLIQEVEACSGAPELEAAGSEEQLAHDGEAAADVATWRRWAAVAGIVTVLLGAWVARQCYLGGTVPWLRQPESFEVTRGEPVGGEETW